MEKVKLEKEKPLLKSARKKEKNTTGKFIITDKHNGNVIE